MHGHAEHGQQEDEIDEEEMQRMLQLEVEEKANLQKKLNQIARNNHESLKKVHDMWGEADFDDLTDNNSRS